jgi:hypothetical protein
MGGVTTLHLHNGVEMRASVFSHSIIVRSFSSRVFFAGLHFVTFLDLRYDDYFFFFKKGKSIAV